MGRVGLTSRSEGARLEVRGCEPQPRAVLIPVIHRQPFAIVGVVSRLSELGGHWAGFAPNGPAGGAGVRNAAWMKRRKPIIGLCGGIGSGKSQVADAFASMGALVIDSDRLHHEIMRLPQVLETLVRWWGPSVLTSDGLPDRGRIAGIVFDDEEQKRRLESLTYPLIAAAREDMISSGIGNPAVTVIVVDSPLLFECNLDRQCDKIVFVEASEELRLERLRVRRRWDLSELRRREKWQLPLSVKRARADFVIHNEGSVESLRPQVAAILEQIASDR